MFIPRGRIVGLLGLFFFTFSNVALPVFPLNSVLPVSAKKDDLNVSSKRQSRRSSTPAANQSNNGKRFRRRRPSTNKLTTTTTTTTTVKRTELSKSIKEKYNFAQWVSMKKKRQEEEEEERSGRNADWSSEDEIDESGVT